MEIHFVDLCLSSSWQKMAVRQSAALALTADREHSVQSRQAGHKKMQLLNLAKTV